MAATRPSRAEQLFFADDANLYRRATPLKMPLDGLGVSMQVHEDFCDAGAGAEIEPDIEQGLAANRHQAFGYGGRERSQARTMTTSQQKGFQGVASRT